MKLNPKVKRERLDPPEVDLENEELRVVGLFLIHVFCIGVADIGSIKMAIPIRHFKSI